MLREPTQSFDVDAILLTPTARLQEDQAFGIHEWNRRRILVNGAVAKHVFVTTTADPGEDVDREVLDEANGFFLVAEILDAQFTSMTFAESGEDGEQLFDVLAIPIDQDVDVLGRPHEAVEPARQTADDEVTHLSAAECGQQFFERARIHPWSSVRRGERAIEGFERIG